MYNNWEQKNNSLIKIFTFKNFTEAVLFVNKIVPISEEFNHHPDIEIFSYKNVKVTLTTHSENRITSKDIEVSKKIDSIF